MLTIIGEHPLAKDERGNLKSRIATLFPRRNTIVTLPGIHATQRIAYIEVLDQERRAKGLPPLTELEQEAEWSNSVDLITEGDCILIRPDPDNMKLAFEADDLLQEMVSKLKIKFLHVFDERVRDAIKRRGEYWRIASLPKTPAEMSQMIATSRIGIGGREIYYYSKATGTRFLTCQEFCQLANVDDTLLRLHLLEIRKHSMAVNRLGHREIDFFMASQSFSASCFAGYDFSTMTGAELRTAHQSLASQFRQAVKPEFQQDDPSSPEWRNQMYVVLVGQRDQVVLEEVMLGLSPEFFLQIEWLPGSRIEEGELIPDSVYEEIDPGNCANAATLRDEKPRGFIFNLVREYGDLEYVNIGRVNASLSRRAPLTGRRGVYIAEVKVRGIDRELVQIIRLQKWGVHEHLEEGKSLLQSMIESEQYTEYILDRRLGCRQLGMNLPPRIGARRIAETYHGRREYEGILIWSTYFDRDYVPGIATDKMPAYRFANEAFALQFAHLLGRAAAPNLIVGRSDLSGSVVFDDGDEVVVMNEIGMPKEIVVADPTGTFAEYRGDLLHFAQDYAMPVNSRVAFLPNPAAFATTYVEALVERFCEIQQEYRKRKRAFGALFKHRPREVGSFAYRWEQVLQRLDRTDGREVGNAIRVHTCLRG
ncbi:MAG: hypothetical protein ACM359_16230 [Bacillota bacterium]